MHSRGLICISCRLGFRVLAECKLPLQSLSLSFMFATTATDFGPLSQFTELQSLKIIDISTPAVFTSICDQFPDLKRLTQFSVSATFLFDSPTSDELAAAFRAISKSAIQKLYLQVYGEMPLDETHVALLGSKITDLSLEYHASASSPAVGLKALTQLTSLKLIPERLGRCHTRESLHTHRHRPRETQP